MTNIMSTLLQRDFNYLNANPKKWLFNDKNRHKAYFKILTHYGEFAFDDYEIFMLEELEALTKYDYDYLEDKLFEIFDESDADHSEEIIYDFVTITLEEDW